MVTARNIGKTRLLLLARQFPYNKGEVAAESFLETEIDYLATHFDEIVAVGTEAPKGSKPTCSLPDNVRSVALGVGNSKMDKVSEVLQGKALSLFAPSFVRESLALDPDADTANKRAFLGYFVARAYRKYQALEKTVQELKYTPTHIYSFWFWDSALVATWLKAAYPHSFAFTRAHGYDLYEYRSSYHYLPLRKYLLQRLDQVFPCSQDGEEYINRNWPGYEYKIHASYLGTRDLVDRSGVARTDTLRVVSCSRVVPVKRVVLIAEAIKLLDAEGFMVEWTHFGDGEQLANAKEKVCSLINARCEFPGNVPNSDLLKIYGIHDFDLFVNASESEGLPISLMEACGTGIPVLATDVGGTREIVCPNVNGVLLPKVLSARQLADAVKRFSDLSDTDRLSLRAGARSVWESDFRAAKNVERLLNIVLGMEGDGQ